MGTYTMLSEKKIHSSIYQICVIGNENYLDAQGGNVTLNWTVKLRLWESKLFAITQSGNALCISRWAVLMYDRSALACLMDGTTGSTVCTELATVFGLRSVIPHMNSLLTLEDIGEKNARPMLSLDDKLQAR